MSIPGGATAPTQAPAENQVPAQEQTPDLLGTLESTPNQTTPESTPNQAQGPTKEEPTEQPSLLDDPNLGESTQEQDPAEANKVPEQYEAFTVPDGMTYNAESPMTQDFVALAKESGLSQSQAQKFVDLMFKHAASGQQALDKQHIQTVNGWVEAVKADPDIGGLNWRANVQQAAQVSTKFATPGFRQLMRETGLSNHPEVIKTFYNISTQFKEDGFPNPGPGSTRLAPEEILYRKSAMK